MIVHGTSGKKTSVAMDSPMTLKSKMRKRPFLPFSVGNARRKGGHRSPVQTGRQSTEGNQASKSERGKKQRSRTHNTEKRKKPFFPRRPAEQQMAVQPTYYYNCSLHFYSAHNSRARTRRTAIGFWPRREREAEEGAKGPSSP